MHGSKLIDGEKFMYSHEDVITPITMGLKGSKAIEFRSKLEINQHDAIMTKDQSVTTKIMNIFPKEEILLQHCVLGY